MRRGLVVAWGLRRFCKAAVQPGLCPGEARASAVKPQDQLCDQKAPPPPQPKEDKQCAVKPQEAAAPPTDCPEAKAAAAPPKDCAEAKAAAAPPKDCDEAKAAAAPPKDCAEAKAATAPPPEDCAEPKAPAPQESKAPPPPPAEEPPKAEECEPACELTETNKPCPKKPVPPPPPPKKEKPPEPPKRCAPKEVKKQKPKPPDMGTVLVDTETPHCEKLAGKFKKSDAYTHISDRLPKVIDTITKQMIDVNGVSAKLKQKFGHGEALKQEVMATAAEFEELKGQVRSGLPLEGFCSQQVDNEFWEKDLALAKAERRDNYYAANLLLAEAHFYRKIHDIRMTKKMLCSWDPLEGLRQDMLKSATAQLVYRCNDIISKGILGPEARELRRGEILRELGSFLKFSMWAGRYDLSVRTANPALLDMGQVDSKVWDSKILVNHTDQVFEHFCPDKPEPACGMKIVDIFVDNCGMEFLGDMLLADFLMSCMQVDLIRFHVKRFPSHVSDVVFSDVPYTIDSLLKLKNYKSIYTLAQRWKDYTKEGRWLWSCEPFLNLGRPFCALKDTDPDFYDALSCATLAIYKGDLNLRRLAQDTNWPAGTGLGQAASFRPCPALVLRCNKSELVVGVPESKAAEVYTKSPDWRTSAEYGVILFQC